MCYVGDLGVLQRGLEGDLFRKVLEVLNEGFRVVIRRGFKCVIKRGFGSV